VFHKTRGLSWIAVRLLLTPQEGLCSSDFVKLLPCLDVDNVKTSRYSGVKFHEVFTSAADVGGGVIFTGQPLYNQEAAPQPTLRAALEVVVRRYISATARNRNPVVQPVARLFMTQLSRLNLW
jgi:hypothetical protein